MKKNERLMHILNQFSYLFVKWVFILRGHSILYEHGDCFACDEFLSKEEPRTQNKDGYIYSSLDKNFMFYYELKKKLMDTNGIRQILLIVRQNNYKKRK